MHASMPVVPFLKHFPLAKNSLELFSANVVSAVQPQMSGLMDLREVCEAHVARQPETLILVLLYL